MSLGWIIDGRACAIHCADPRWITVPAGHRTDFASIPRVLWPLLPPVGRTGKAAVIHDWLCDEHPHSVDHKMAADIFNEAMTVLGEPPLAPRHHGLGRQVVWAQVSGWCLSYPRTQWLKNWPRPGLEVPG